MSDREPNYYSEQMPLSESNHDSRILETNDIELVENWNLPAIHSNREHRRNTASLLSSAIQLLVCRILYATIAISLLMHIVSRSVHPLVVNSGFILDGRLVNISINGSSHISKGAPMVVGMSLKKPLSGIKLFLTFEGSLISLDHLPCYGLEMTNSIEKLISYTERRVESDRNWIGIVSGFGCDINQKLLMMQRLGIQAAIVVDDQSGLKNKLSRTHLNSGGDSIKLFSVIISAEYGVKLMSILQEAKHPPWTTLSYEDTWFSKSDLVKLCMDIIILFVLVLSGAFTIFFMGFVLSLMNNVSVHGTFQVVQTIHEAALSILSETTTSKPSVLDQIRFPSRIVQSSDLMVGWKLGGLVGYESCPICIEQFEIGDSVRILPCQHQFHSLW
ncbi:hypothetical protein HDV02_001856 [Globomyces sp. JEL0801]|nr:hypothetical protein HDV02_001856 [Globomyces sp. JEL0801]